ncbi:unnamed protein product [Jaminaea pallidilutea]
MTGPAAYFHDLLTAWIPTPVFAILAGFSNLIYRLVLGVSNDPSSWTSTLLPPIIAILIAYLALLLAWRTLRNAVLLVFWALKWGTIIAIGIAIWAWWTGESGAVQSVGRTPLHESVISNFNWIAGVLG